MHANQLIPILKGAALVCAALVGFNPCVAQEKPPSNSIGVAFTTMRYIHYEQYIGVGLDYTYLHHQWIGVKLDADVYPERQQSVSDIGGLAVVQVSGSALAGHRWGRFGLYGEAGFGGLLPQIYTGNSDAGSSSYYSVYTWRESPALVYGGVFKIAVARRWSMNYEVRGSRVFFGPYQETYIPPSTPAQRLNVPQARVGISFNFH